MEHFITFIVSALEWLALLSFPVILLGYRYQKLIKFIGLHASIMSLFSIMLHTTGLHVTIIVAIQIVVLFFLIKLFYQTNYLESLVITSMGYGFYIFFQLLIVEIMSQAFKYSYFQFFFAFDIKTTLQLITCSLVFIFTYIIYHFQFHLNELRYCIRNTSIKRKYKMFIITNSILTFVLICLVIFTMLAVESANKYMLIIGITIVLFLMLSVHMVLHNFLQIKRIIEAKKFYLDQEQQIGSILEKMQGNYTKHFQAILTLSAQSSPQMIDQYIKSNHLQDVKFEKGKLSFSEELLDELLYAFLINKRKLAELMGVTIEVSGSSEGKVPITLQQVRYLSSIIDDIIFTLYQNASREDKIIYFFIQATKKEITFEISCPHYIKEENKVLKLYDGLIEFKNAGATIESRLNPISLSIRCPIT